MALTSREPDQTSVTDALAYLWAAYRINPDRSPHGMAVWLDMFKHYPPRAVWDAVERRVRSPEKFCPSPGEFRALMASPSTPAAREPMPTPDDQRTGNSSMSALLGKPAGDAVTAKCAEGDCGEFQTEQWYLDNIAQLNGMNGAKVHVLCDRHAGEYLALQAERAKREEKWAWPILVAITRNDQRPTQEQVNRLHAIGFGPELNSRLAKCGAISREPQRRRR